MKKTIIYLILLILLVSSVSAGNVSINYGWNGTAFIPFRLTGDERLMTDINKVNVTAGKLVVDTDTLYVDNENNRVGVLQTSPNVTFGVSGSANVTGIFYAGSANITNTIEAAYFVGDGSLLSGIDTSFTNNTDINVTNFVANNTLFVNGSMAGIGAVNPVVELEVEGGVNISGGLNVTNGDVLLATSSGRVGIGTSSPQKELHVIGSANVTGTVYAHNFSGNSNISFLNASGEEVVRITDSGNVGIGTTSPSSNLDVAGNFEVDGSDFFVNSSSGNVGIGTTSPGQRLHVEESTVNEGIQLHNTAHNVAGSTPIFITSEDSSGNLKTVSMEGQGNGIFSFRTGATTLGGWGTQRLQIAVDGTLTASASNDISDVRLKENIVTVERSLDKIMQLRGVKFNWKEETNMTDRDQFGVIAQEVETVFPELVLNNSIHGEGYKSVQYGGFVSPFIESIKELNSKISVLEQENQQLKQIICLDHLEEEICK